MPPLTPQATVVEAVARHEAELLDQPAASGHVVVAIIWTGGGLGSAALAQAGLPKGSEEEVRQRLANATESERGGSTVALLVQAARIASDLGHDYVGTEHQLLAVIRDPSLGEKVLPAGVRQRTSEWIEGRLKRRPDA
jgi:hypothetical protein